MTDDPHGAALRGRLTDEELNDIAEWASVTVEDVAAMVDEIRERRALDDDVVLLARRQGMDGHDALEICEAASRVRSAYNVSEYNWREEGRCT